MIRVPLTMLMLLLAVPAFAAQGVQVQPDALGFLVSKDVGNERWAITLSLHDDAPLTVTGNVFRGGDSEPAFVFCTPVDVSGDQSDIHNTLITFSCSGAEKCTGPTTCSRYNFISEVTLPGGFFLP